MSDLATPRFAALVDGRLCELMPGLASPPASPRVPRTGNLPFMECGDPLRGFRWSAAYSTGTRHRFAPPQLPPQPSDKTCLTVQANPRKSKHLPSRPNHNSSARLGHKLTQTKRSTSQFLIDDFRTSLPFAAPKLPAAQADPASTVEPSASSSNRQFHILEPRLSHRKQRIGRFLIAGFGATIRSTAGQRRKPKSAARGSFILFMLTRQCGASSASLAGPQPSEAAFRSRGLASSACPERSQGAQGSRVCSDSRLSTLKFRLIPGFPASLPLCLSASMPLVVPS
jgi:hypothetical protein